MLLNSFLKRIFKKLKPQNWSCFHIVIIICCYGIACVLLGAYLNKTGLTGTIKRSILIIIQGDYSFVPKYAAGKTIAIDQFDITIKLKNWDKLVKYRDSALTNGGITPEMEKEISAKIRYKNHDYKIDLNITGCTVEHVIDPEKWSLAVKVKDGKTIMGMRTFALLVPMARGGLTDWIATKLLKSRNVIGLRGNFVNVSINGNDNGIYYLEERYDKLLIENNQFKEGIVFKADGINFDVYGLKKIKQSKELSAQLVKLKQMWYGFLNNEVDITEIFDLKKFASLFVVSDIMNQKHAIFLSNTRLYFNPVTSLIEPIGREWGDLVANSETSLSIEKPRADVFYHIQMNEDIILKKIINSTDFIEEYIKEAEILSEPKHLDSIIRLNNIEKEGLLHKLYKENPFYVFPYDLLRKNQNYIRKKIIADQPLIMAYFNKKSNDSIFCYVKNKTDLPIEIHGFLYNNRKIVLNNKILIKSDHQAPDTFQKISLYIKNCPVNFSSDSVEILYNIIGLRSCQKTIVYPKKMLPEDYAKLSLIKRLPNYKEFDFLKIDETNKQITFAKKTCEVRKDIIIAPGYSVIAVPGCKINLCNSSRIISYSPLLFLGKKDSVITITSSDSTGQGIIVYSTSRTSEFSFVNFEYLKNPTEFGWYLSGSVTLYESPVIISDCHFNRNFSGDDYLNIIRSEFDIRNSTFQNTNADALDCDFSFGKLNNVDFKDIGGDAIDISGSQINISNINLFNAGDKGISAGEQSYLVGNNVNITGGEIGVVSKDNSLVKINKINISKTRIAYCAYQKKPEFGRGIIIADNSRTRNVKMDYLIETGSSLTINKMLINGVSKNVHAHLPVKSQ